LEKMEENINNTLNNEGYKSAISCFKQSENDILSGEGGQCIPEKDYIKSVGGMETTSEESSPVYGTEADADAVNTEADTKTSPDDVQKENTETSSSSPATEEEAAAVNTEASPDDAAPAVNTEADTKTSPDDEAAAAAPNVNDTSDTKEQQGGRSKRRPRSSRRGKSMKSKKGRRTRRR
jgi:hypothetical protein